MTSPLPTIAYFSMEVGLDSKMPTYSGGLGILSGDTLRSAADLQVPMVGVTLLYRQGYFQQDLDASGQQTEEPVAWRPEDHLERLDPTVIITIEERRVAVRAWRCVVRGITGHTVPVYFLDTALPENDAWDRSLTGQLYGGDSRYRLGQEAVLGLGGVAMLEALGHTGPLHYHLNEGHAALLILALLERRSAGRSAGWTDEDVEAVRTQCIFTTHTPVPAGHDRFESDVVRRLLGADRTAALEAAECIVDGHLNMTYLALRFARYVNGVALRHGEVSQGMFPHFPINTITNGVHAITWTSAPFQELFDRRIAGWRRDNLYLRYAMDLPLHEIERAHAQAKRALLDEVTRLTGRRLSPETLTMGFARRATPYKRADLIFHDPDRLRWIAKHVGPIQIFFAGKAHPKDEPGKALIRKIFETAAVLGDDVPVVYLERYDMDLARLLVAGVDCWLNTPLKPLEASGTSGMKAALNGVPSFSVLDGWWIEGHIEGVTGWSIGEGDEPPDDPATELVSLYRKLEQTIVPLFYGRPAEYVEVMRTTIALNGSFFNTQRMLAQYISNAYVPNGAPRNGASPTPPLGVPDRVS